MGLGEEPQRRRDRAAPGARRRRAWAGDCRTVLGALLAAISLVLLAGAAPAAAQTGPYTATPPTRGALYADGQDDRWLLGGEWLYQADPGNIGIQDGWWRGGAGTAGWSPVTVPNSYNAGDFSTASMNGSVGWYRRDFVIPAGAFARYVPKAYDSWIVRFESVNYYASAWLNGRFLGSHAGAYLPFEFPLKGLRKGVNRLVVRVDDQRTPEDTPPGPSGGWWNFGGIQREVYLRSVQRADMEQVIVRPLLSCPTCFRSADVQEQAWVHNTTSAPQAVALRGTYGGRRLDFGTHVIAPGQVWYASAQVRIRSPHLWAPGSPYLYTARLTLTDARGRVLERYFTYSGIRSIVVVGGHLELNGRLLNLRGFDLHEQNLQTGAALTPAQLSALVGWVRDLGATIIRAHYPLNPEIAQMADRDGILLWSEIPVYQVQSQYLGTPTFEARAHTLLRENILENENHPSVVIWSIGNELPTPPSPAEAGYIAGQAAIAHQMDPTRPVGMAISDWPGVPCQTAYAPLDVIGFNDYFGWFDAGGGSTDDRDELGPFLDSLHACYPAKALMVTEFGFEGNRDGPVDVYGTYAFQADAALYHLSVFESKPYLSGAMWFALQTFAAHPGWTGGDPLGDPPWVQKGAIDQFGNETPLFGVLQQAYQSTQQITPPPS